MLSGLDVVEIEKSVGRQRDGKLLFSKVDIVCTAYETDIKQFMHSFATKDQLQNNSSKDLFQDWKYEEHEDTSIAELFTNWTEHVEIQGKLQLFILLTLQKKRNRKSATINLQVSFSWSFPIDLIFAVNDIFTPPPSPSGIAFLSTCQVLTIVTATPSSLPRTTSDALLKIPQSPVIVSSPPTSPLVVK